MPTQACLDNIRRMRPPVYCDDVSPGFCQKIQGDINQYCHHISVQPNTPVPSYVPGHGLCYCCCDQPGAETAVEIESQLYKPIEEIGVGQMVLATDPGLTTWQPRAVTEIGGIGPRTELDALLRARFRLQDGRERALVGTADQLLLRADPADPTLVSLHALRPGDRLRQADGGTAIIAAVAETQRCSGVRHVVLGPYEAGAPLDGHLMNANGLVAADLAVQVAYYLRPTPPSALAHQARN